MTTFAMPWIAMLFLALIVCGVVAAIIWRSWIVGGIVLVLLLLIGGYSFALRAVPVASQTPATPEPLVALPDALEFSPEHLQSADVFTSNEEAATALAQRIIDELDRKPKPQDINRINIVTRETALIDPISQVFQRSYPKADIKANNNPG